MRFPWSRPKNQTASPATVQNSPQMLDPSVTAFFEQVAPKQSLITKSTPLAEKTDKPLMRQPVNVRPDSAEHMAERRIRQWILEQEAEQRALHSKIRKP